MKKRKKILIIGGTGFIGYHLANKCKKVSWEVISVSTKKPKLIRKIQKVKYLTCDISKKKNIHKKLLNYSFDFVVNLGGYVDHSNKKKVFQTHLLGCKNLADFFLDKNLKTFIQLGTGLEYGKNINTHKESFKCNPKSNYATSKYKATKYLIKLFKKKNFPVIILSLYQAYGSHQDLNRLIPYTIINSLKNKTFNCSEGNQLRDFIYVDDLINLIIKALLNNRAKGQIFNVGSGYKIKIKELIKKIVFLCKKGNPIFGATKMRKDESPIMCPNITKIKKVFKFRNKYSINKGLKKTISFYNRYV